MSTLTDDRRITFMACVARAFADPEFLTSFDDIAGTNMSLRGTPLDLAIDEATGRLEADMGKFLRFVKEHIWDCLPPDARVRPGEDPAGELIIAVIERSGIRGG